MSKPLLLVYCMFLYGIVSAEDGYELWLRYRPIDNPQVLQAYRKTLSGLHIPGNTSAAKEELLKGLSGLLNTSFPTHNNIRSRSLVVATPATLPLISSIISKQNLDSAGNEGFIIATVSISKTPVTLITANSEIGLLYGAFHFLRQLQCHRPVDRLSLVSRPKSGRRILNHWDNLDRHVERGYAGASIWDWHRLPAYVDSRYKDYARANASIGINGTVLTNVNANAHVLTDQYLQKVKALADVFRPYGIRVYLTARFSAPSEIGGLRTADPSDTAVRNWWTKKIKDIYKYIPDFGGFLVKANSEGQPGPQNYGKTHADGANMLAEALAPFGGLVMWRAFVYSNETPDDRFKQAYNEFKPLDGKFLPNVMVQVKNGPIDFQPREPFHPLFGAMPQTPLMMEFQLTQEYLGFATHLVYLPRMFREVLDADTHVNGGGSKVAGFIRGMAGVANIGSDRNWCGHPFAQSNWYGFGRLSWDHALPESDIADEWIRQTLGNNPGLVVNVKVMMMNAHHFLVNYMTPLGLHHIMGYGHHYGPAPWYDKAPRADWNPVYFHRADSIGLGFDRTSKGSNALVQYAPAVRRQFESLQDCPEEYLLWFHHVRWDHKMRSGRTLWEELCHKYQYGVDGVRKMRDLWSRVKKDIDAERAQQVSMLLDIQVAEAEWWRDACLLYFQQFSRKPLPAGVDKPAHTLEYYQGLHFPYAPGNG